MLPIYVCDDQKAHLMSLTQIIEKIIIIDEVDMELKYQSETPEELLAYLADKKGPALYFLDIALKVQMNGLQLAEEIRKLDPRGFIVFVTTHDEMAPLTFQYKVEAMDFIIKENTKELANRIRECMEYALRQYISPFNQIHKVLAIPLQERIVTIVQDDIIFLENAAQAHKIRIHKENSIMDIYSTLKELKILLDEHFFQCHKCYIINMDRVVEVNTKERKVIMDNGMVCDVSIRRLKELEQKLFSITQKV